MKYLFLFLIVGLMVLVSCLTKNEIYPYLIAYNVAMNEQQSDYDIWTVDPVTQKKVNITSNTDVAWVYSSWGNSLFFQSDRDTCTRCFFLYEMDVNGKNVERITDFKMRDSWLGISNSGNELIINPHPSVDSAFLIINRKGKVLNRIDPGLPSFNDPLFSNDGNQIVFRGGLKKSKREEGYVDELYSINIDGSGLKQLTHYPRGDTLAPWYAYKSGPPRWHPTENFISYQSMRNGKYSLYAVTPDGSKQWKLTQNKQEEGWHDWSPDGRWLAIEVFDSTQSQFHIGLMDWKTKELKILTDTIYTYQQAPVFISRH